MKGDRTSGWLEPGDIVEAGDLVFRKNGSLVELEAGGYEHKAHHAPKWRPAVRLPPLEERARMLAISKEVLDRQEEEKRERFGR